MDLIFGVLMIVGVICVFVMPVLMWMVIGQGRTIEKLMDRNAVQAQALALQRGKGGPGAYGAEVREHQAQALTRERRPVMDRPYDDAGQISVTWGNGMIYPSEEIAAGWAAQHQAHWAANPGEYPILSTHGFEPTPRPGPWEPPSKPGSVG